MAVSHPDPGVVDELVHAVEAAPDLYLALDAGRASVVLAGEEGLRRLSSGPASPGVARIGLAVDGDLREVARVSLRCGAHDIVCWPRDGATLRETVRDAASRARLAAGGADGTIIAVVSARGGAGATTVAAMVASALPDSAVVELDAAGAGLSAFLPKKTEPTLASVLDVVEDLDPGGLRAALVPHAAGRALCSTARGEPPSPERVERLLALLRASVPTAVLDVGRASDAGARAAIRLADVVLCICAPDLQSMRGARALAAGVEVSYVLNMATRLRLGARDVGRVLGAAPVALIPFDGSVRKAGESGRLAARGPARRAVNRLAASVVAERSDGR